MLPAKLCHNILQCSQWHCTAELLSYRPDLTTPIGKTKLPANTNPLSKSVSQFPTTLYQSNKQESYNKRKSFPKMTYDYICWYCLPVFCCVLLYQSCSSDTCTIIIYFHLVPPVAQQPPHRSYFPTELEFISLRSDKHSHRSIPHSCRNHHPVIKRSPDSYHCQLLSCSFPR